MRLKRGRTRDCKPLGQHDIAATEFGYTYLIALLASGVPSPQFNTLIYVTRLCKLTISQT